MSGEVHFLKLLSRHGLDIPAILFRGKFCLLARDVSLFLEYANPAALGELIRGEWHDEFLEGVDFDVLTGSELKELKEVLEVTGCDPVTFAPHLMVLYEAGVTLAGMRSTKQRGMDLRRWMATEVVPAIVRTGSYKGAQGSKVAIPENMNAVDQALFFHAVSSANVRAQLRLAAQEKQIEAQGEQLVLAAPKVEFYDDVTESPSYITWEEAAKILNWGRVRLGRRARELGYIQKTTIRLLPIQQYEDEGWFKVIPVRVENQGRIRIRTQTMVTGLGLAKLREKIGMGK